LHGQITPELPGITAHEARTGFPMMGKSPCVYWFGATPFWLASVLMALIFLLHTPLVVTPFGSIHLKLQWLNPKKPRQISLTRLLVNPLHTQE
jgi:hypothetical protein